MWKYISDVWSWQENITIDLTVYDSNTTKYRELHNLGYLPVLQLKIILTQSRCCFGRKLQSFPLVSNTTVNFALLIDKTFEPFEFSLIQGI